MEGGKVVVCQPALHIAEISALLLPHTHLIGHRGKADTLSSRGETEKLSRRIVPEELQAVNKMVGV